jgi:hypothetical protein
MHAFPDMRAVTGEPFGGSIAAALASREFMSVRSIAAAADIESRLANGGPIPLAELDAALTAKHIGSTSRIALKSALGRLGLIKN